MLSLSDTQLVAWLSAFILPFFRILALMSSAPLLSTRSVPVRFRIALSMLLALVAAPWVNSPPVAWLGSPAGLLLVVQQVLIGLAIGFSARLVFAAFETAGEIVGLQMGLSYAGFFDPSSGSANAVGRTFSTLALLSFVTMNGPLLLVGAILHSFSTFPIQLDTAAGPMSAFPWQLREIVGMGSNIFAAAIALALPIIAMLLFVNLTLGIVSRVAPQFNIFSVGFPVTVACGLFMLTVGLPLLEAPLLNLSTDFMQLLLR